MTITPQIANRTAKALQWHAASAAGDRILNPAGCIVALYNSGEGSVEVTIPVVREHLHIPAFGVLRTRNWVFSLAAGGTLMLTINRRGYNDADGFARLSAAPHGDLYIGAFVPHGLPA